MTDYRDPYDPLRPGTQYQYEPVSEGRHFSWGWIAGALVLVVLAALAFSVGHGPIQTASNETAPPAANRLAPPPLTAAPRPLNPAYPGLTPPAPQGSLTPPVAQGSAQSQ